jgi:hypothetical protein
MIVIRIDTQEQISPALELEWRRWQESVKNLPAPEWPDVNQPNVEADDPELAEMVLNSGLAIMPRRQAL